MVTPGPEAQSPTLVIPVDEIRNVSFAIVVWGPPSQTGKNNMRNLSYE